ncbi:MAG TPA: hypothetical protein VL485_19170 [Ktedonobacteraceae bacterium]|jgi:hypothetical protein|nr:hypothetical protein [Ktedonobacteraceae bacterium]
MSRFRQGLIVYVLLSVLIALAIALTLNDERRRQLRNRFEKLQDALPDVEQLKQSAQDAATRARETGSDLNEQVQASAGKLVQHTQEILSTVQQKATALGEKQPTNGVI